MPWADMDPAKFWLLAAPLLLLVMVGVAALLEHLQERRK